MFLYIYILINTDSAMIHAKTNNYRIIWKKYRKNVLEIFINTVIYSVIYSLATVEK